MVIPVYLMSGSMSTLLLGAFLMGASGTGIWAMAPAYLTERFPTSVRGVGPGLSYHVGAAIGSFTPAVLGALQDGGMGIVNAMSTCIAISGLAVACIIWLGPETRGREFKALEDLAMIDKYHNDHIK